MAAAAATSGPRTKWRKPEFRFPGVGWLTRAHSPTSAGVDRMSGATDHHYVESRRRFSSQSGGTHREYGITGKRKHLTLPSVMRGVGLAQPPNNGKYSALVPSAQHLGRPHR
ncbi:hypothetical protein MTO96_007555 [Rhipicephalus appendiculatus]